MKINNVWITAALLAALSLLPASAVADEALVAKFGKLFLAGAHDQYAGMLNGAMRNAMGPEQAMDLVAQLEAQHGKVLGVGEAWWEDEVQGYPRYRLPVTFEKSELDLRIVLDGESRIAGLFIVPHLPPPSERPEREAPCVEHDVRVGEGETALPGTLSIPDGDGPFPGVVLVHGSGPNDRDETIGPNKPFRDLAWGLAERGVAVLRYDKRSHARPGDLLAAGEKMTVREEVIDDARIAMQLLRDRVEVDGKRVFLLGHSLGGTLAPRIAAAGPKPAGVVVLAGATLPLPEKMLEQVRYIALLDGKVTDREKAQGEELEKIVTGLRAALDGDAVPPPGMILGAPVGYYSDLESDDPPATAAKAALPILVLQGKRDYQVTLGDYERWKEALSGKPFACLKLYDGLDHLFRKGVGFSGPHDYERIEPVAAGVIDDIARWIATGECPAAGEGR